MDGFAGGGSWEGGEGVGWGGACFPLKDVSGLKKKKKKLSCTFSGLLQYLFVCFHVFCSVYSYVFRCFVVFVCFQVFCRICMFSGVLQCLYVFGCFAVFVCFQVFCSIYLYVFRCFAVLFVCFQMFCSVCLYVYGRFAVFNCMFMVFCNVCLHIVFSSSSAVSTFCECGLFFLLRAQ